jgi:hypothetical protein
VEFVAFVAFVDFCGLVSNVIKVHNFLESKIPS